jgi:sugar diacid utilization regulator
VTAVVVEARKSSGSAVPSTLRQAHGPECDGLRKLTLLATLMMGMDEPAILALAQSAVPELGPTSAPWFHLEGQGWWPAERWVDGVLMAEMVSQGADGLMRASGTRLFALPISGSVGHLGHMVIEMVPGDDFAGALFTMQVFCQQLAAALDNARRHVREMQLAADLQRAVEEVGALLAMQEQLTLAAARHGDIENVVRVVSELTRRPASLEDQRGSVLATAGGWSPNLKRRSQAARTRLLDRLRRGVRAERDGDQLVVVAESQVGNHVLLMISDSEGSATATHARVLEFAATVLSMMLAKSVVVAEAEMRLRRDLIEELLLGLSQPIAEARAVALDIQISRTRRVVVIEPVNAQPASRVDDGLLQLVQRELQVQGDPGLAVTRGAGVVCLSHDDIDWDEVLGRVDIARGTQGFRAGVGSSCRAASDYPTSLRHAQQSLRFAGQTQGRRIVRFDDLGVYRLLALNSDKTDLDGFIDQWLGTLLDYDSVRSADLVNTLSSYLRSGGALAATASELFVHRSTVKYRLERIRAITKLDLSDPETLFSLQLATYALETRRTLSDTASRPSMVLVTG